MTTLTFDTLAYSKKLRAVGFTEEQAEAQAETIINLMTEQLATKTDLKEVEAGLKRDIKELDLKFELKMKELESNLKRDIKEMELRLENKIAENKTETIKWVAAMLVAQAGVIAAMVRLL
jgi:predicted phage-related endonuclease